MEFVLQSLFTEAVGHSGASETFVWNWGIFGKFFQVSEVVRAF